MSHEVESGRTSDSRVSRPHPFSVVSLMCDRGLQKSHTTPPPVTKSEHKFSVESLLQHKGSGDQQASITVREPVKCSLNLEERVIKDDFTSWLSSTRYNPASKYWLVASNSNFRFENARFVKNTSLTALYKCKWYTVLLGFVSSSKLGRQINPE
jgi:hypothetical protein